MTDNADEMIKKEEERLAEEKAAEPELAGIGDNSAADVGGVAGKRLLSFIERVERVRETKREAAEDEKEIWAEAKGIGFHVPTAKKIVKLREMDTEKRREADELLDLYKTACGIV